VKVGIVTLAIVTATAFGLFAKEERRQGVPGDREERRQGVPGDREERRQGVPGDQDHIGDQPRSSTAGDRLAPTAHPPLPADPSQYWFVPDAPASPTSASGRENTALMRFTRGAQLIASGEFAAGLPLVSTKELAASPLAPYADYYMGVALAGLSRLAEADAVLTELAVRKPEGYLREAGTLRLADVLVRNGAAARAEDLLEDLSKEKVRAPEAVFLALAGAEEAVAHRDHALEAYRRIYYDYPMSSEAVDAQSAIERLQTADLIPPDRYKRELSRAEQLFAARRWAQARAAFHSLARAAQGDDRELIALRLAEADYYLDRHRAARDGLRPLVDRNKREAEAQFFYLTAVRALGDTATYVRLARQLVTDHPDSEWAAETLNNLASHHIVADDDAQADVVFRELLRRFPRHRYSERAAWKAGWLAYRNRKFAETAEIFENAAFAFPRGDNRPAWLYWSGRSRDQLGDEATANARYRLAVADYQNSYYGRLAAKILRDRGEPLVPPTTRVAAAGAPPDAVPNDGVIRALAAAELYEEALREVQYAQRVWGDSPQLQATAAWIRHRQGLGLKATERFTALRGAITTMRRAYPQFLAAGGEHLPPEVLRIIFPLDFWPLITKYAKSHDLDPFLLAALMVQESTFTPEIRSAANAYGLMQVIPATGRTVARQLGIKGFSTSMLTTPETNVRIGTKYFKDMVDKFGGVHYALAGYNAGPHRVVTWRQEAPGLPQDEFIDNIPFAETQAYVKRILGTAEDYRRLYGTGVLDPNERLVAAAR
jgi:soluble lytic murein transglycosylase